MDQADQFTVKPVLRSGAKINNPATKALVALAILAALPAFVPIPVNLNIIATASLCVFVGCWRSVKATPPEDSMSRKDAMTFPLIGSAVLLGLFLLFKFLPQELVNTVLTAYFVLIGIFAITVTIAPFVALVFPRSTRSREFKLPSFSIPYFLQEPVEVCLTTPELCAAVVSTAFCVWYFLKKHWLANNVLGLALAIQGIENLSLGSVTTGVILLSGLFFYDIFWVFCTPVMVSVAKNFDAPIKLLFPRSVGAGVEKPFSMLGLGDIVIPGVFVALLLRYDTLNNFKTMYFYSTFGGYVAGLVSTILVMNVFKAAQPALLYLVPAIIGALALHSSLLKSFKKVFAFSEAKEEEEGSAELKAEAEGSEVEGFKTRSKAKKVT